MKKIFYISLTLFVLTLIFLGAYNFAFKNNASNPVADPEKKQAVKEENDAVVPTLPGRFESPINEEVLGAVAGPDDTLFYYSLDDKAIKKSTLEGKNKETLLSNLPGVPSRLLWSQKRGRVLLLLKQVSGQPLWYFADLTTKTLVPLKPEISRVVWNNLGDRIFYQYTDPQTGKRSINVSLPDGSDWKRLADAGMKETFLAAIPQSTAVSFWSRPNALEKTLFETVDIMGENRRTLFTDKFGADYLWSPDGEKVLVSTSKGKGGNSMFLDVMNKNGGEYRNLSAPTFVSKAVWSKDSKTVYYALPNDVPESAVLPNDYFDKPIYTKDTFWKMELGSDDIKKTHIVDVKDITQRFDSIDLFLSASEEFLFFTDRMTHRLYRIAL